MAILLLQMVTHSTYSYHTHTYPHAVLYHVHTARLDSARYCYVVKLLCCTATRATTKVIAIAIHCCCWCVVVVDVCFCLMRFMGWKGFERKRIWEMVAWYRLFLCEGYGRNVYFEEPTGIENLIEVLLRI